MLPPAWRLSTGKVGEEMSKKQETGPAIPAFEGEVIALADIASDETIETLGALASAALTTLRGVNC